MKLSQVRDLLDCTVLCGDDDLEREITSCMSSDMMSDVLAYAEPRALLVTGLINLQSIRTADIADASAVIYVRGKRPNGRTLAMAGRLGLPVLVTEHSMFKTCGLLFREGLGGLC